MRPFTHLTSPENPRLRKLYRLIREHRYRRRTGLFVAEGLRLVLRALEAGLTIRQLFLCPDLPHNPQDQPQLWQQLEHRLPSHLPCFQLTPSLMRKVAYRQNPEAVLAVFQQPRWSLPDWPGSSSAEQPPAACRPVRLSDQPLLLVAVGVSKPGNLGAMARTAAAANADALLVADAPIDPFNPNALHASTGAVFTLPILAAPSSAVIDFLLRHRIRILAADVHASLPYTQTDMTAPIALVIGAEDRGLDPLWLQTAQHHGACITIPMPGKIVDSLNASNAAAVLLFEALRQRQRLRS